LELPSAWRLSRGAGITVAVVDTGVDATLPQLAGRVQLGPDLIATTGNADSDCSGHGTALAAIVAAAPTAGAGFAGVAPAATVLPIRVSNGTGAPDPSKVAAGILRAASAGAQVILVGADYDPSSAVLREAVAAAARRSCVIVPAAEPTLGQPATRPTAAPTSAIPGLAVVSALGQNDTVLSDPAPPRPAVTPDLLAPGTGVTTLGRSGRGTVIVSGNPFAAAFVAGVVALVDAYLPGQSPAELISRLEVTADHPAADLPDPARGWGTVRPMAALSANLTAPGAPAPALPPAEAIRVPRLVATSHHPNTAALASTLGALGAATVVAGISACLRARRRRLGEHRSLPRP